MLPPRCLRFRPGALSFWRRLLGACAGRLSPAINFLLYWAIRSLRRPPISPLLLSLLTSLRALGLAVFRLFFIHLPHELAGAIGACAGRPSPVSLYSLIALCGRLRWLVPHGHFAPSRPSSLLQGFAPNHQIPPLLGLGGYPAPAPAAFFAPPPLPSYFCISFWALGRAVSLFFHSPSSRTGGALPAAYRLFPCTPLVALCGRLRWLVIKFLRYSRLSSLALGGYPAPAPAAHFASPSSLFSFSFLLKWRRLSGSCAGRLSPVSLYSSGSPLRGYSICWPFRTLSTLLPPAGTRPNNQVSPFSRLSPVMGGYPAPAPAAHFASASLKALVLAVFLISHSTSS